MNTIHSAFEYKTSLSMVAMRIMCKLSSLFILFSDTSFVQRAMSFFQFPEYILACLHACCAGVTHTAYTVAPYRMLSEEMCCMYWCRKPRYVTHTHTCTHACTHAHIALFNFATIAILHDDKDQTCDAAVESQSCINSANWTAVQRAILFCLFYRDVPFGQVGFRQMFNQLFSTMIQAAQPTARKCQPFSLYYFTTRVKSIHSIILSACKHLLT